MRPSEACNVLLYQSGYCHNFPKSSKASTFADMESVAEKMWPFTDFYFEKCLDMTDVNVYQPYNQPFRPVAENTIRFLILSLTPSPPSAAQRSM